MGIDRLIGDGQANVARHQITGLFIDMVVGWQLAAFLEIEPDHDGLFTPCERGHVDAVQHMPLFSRVVFCEHLLTSEWLMWMPSLAVARLNRDEIPFPV
jgi:hypothetical protein